MSSYFKYLNKNSHLYRRGTEVAAIFIMHATPQHIARGTMGDIEKDNVISLKEYKIKKNMMMPKEKLFYLSKTDLLSQLIDYYEAVKKDPFSIEVALWGEDLMDVISMRALTRELTELAERHQQEGPLAIFKLDKK